MGSQPFLILSKVFILLVHKNTQLTVLLSSDSSILFFFHSIKNSAGTKGIVGSLIKKRSSSGFSTSRQLTRAERRKLNITKHEAGAAIEKNDNVINKIRQYKSLIKTMETECNQVIQGILV